MIDLAETAKFHPSLQNFSTIETLVTEDRLPEPVVDGNSSNPDDLYIHENTAEAGWMFHECGESGVGDELMAGSSQDYERLSSAEDEEDAMGLSELHDTTAPLPNYDSPSEMMAVDSMIEGGWDQLIVEMAEEGAEAFTPLAFGEI